MITSSGPVNRHITEYLTDQRGVKQYRCKTLQNPDYYRTSDGLFLPVDATERLDTSTTHAGSIWLRDRGIFSIGTKKADDAYKIIGLRPDENQSGSEQFEISSESIELSGKAQTINLKDRVEVSEITTCFGGNLYVQRARQRCRVMALAHNTDDSFKIVYRFHMKGLTPVYRDDLDEWWIYNDADVFRFRIGRPYLVGMDMNPLEVDAPMVKHSLVKIGKGEYLYTKEAAPAFESAELPAEYLIDADTVYSSTADGRILGQGSDWGTVHDAATGINANTTITSNAITMSAYYESPDIRIARSFFYYDTTLISAGFTSVSQFIYGITNGATQVMAMLGTQADTLGVADFDSFTGNTFGNTTGWSTSGYNEIVYNATGLAGINTGGITKICNREKLYDFDNNTPGESVYHNGCYYSDDTSGTKDPYLLVTMAAGATGGPFPFFIRSGMHGGFQRLGGI